MSEENGQMSEFTEEAVREELRAWLEENWNPARGLLCLFNFWAALPKGGFNFH